MKKIILLALISICMMVMVSEALAWDDCPKGEIDCLYPGDCNQYIDTNNDGICDHSQPEPTTTTTTTESNITNETTETTEITISVVTPTTITEKPASHTITYDSRYGVKYIAPFVIGAYIISIFFMKKRNRIRLWNHILLGFFTISSISGILLAVGINPYIEPSFLWWHVETGVVMTIVGIAHFIWHLRYFKVKRRKH